MARNNLNLSFAQLLFVGKECQMGASVLGPTIPLVINTSAAIGSNRANALSAEALYTQARSSLSPLGEALIESQSVARLFAFTTRDWLENFLGRTPSLDWVQVGFPADSLAIPQAEGALGTLVEQMGLYLGNNPARENAALQVTAARAGVVYGALTTARSNYNAAKQLCGTRKVFRDESVVALRVRLRGLITELTQAIGKFDPRWREFGLNIPGAPAVPAAPKNVVVNNEMEGQFLISCAVTPRAEMYRFYTQAAGEEEPVFRGHAPAPLFLLADLTPGTVYQVFVSGSNAGGEGRFSAPVSAVVSGAASAVA